MNLYQITSTVLLATTVFASAGAQEKVQPRIAWFGQLDDALAESQRTGRPILLVSGAPQCLGVAGIW